MFILKVDILYELESWIANKITMKAIYEDLQPAKDLLCSLSNRVIERALVKRILGYKLGRSIDDLKIGDVDVWGTKFSCG
jgi:hypothetical protein